MLPAGIRDRICAALSRQPYSVVFDDNCKEVISVFAWPGDKVYKNKNESYYPFIAEDFFRDPSWEESAKNT